MNILVTGSNGQLGSEIRGFSCKLYKFWFRFYGFACVRYLQQQSIRRIF